MSALEFGANVHLISKISAATNRLTQTDRLDRSPIVWRDAFSIPEPKDRSAKTCTLCQPNSQPVVGCPTWAGRVACGCGRQHRFNTPQRLRSSPDFLYSQIESAS